MRVEVVTIPKHELEALIQDAVREAYAEAHRSMSSEIEQMKAHLRASRGILTREDVAELMGCDPSGMYRHHAKGLRFSKPGQRAVYRLDDVMEYLEVTNRRSG
jgi:hypothetical protein